MCKFTRSSGILLTIQGIERYNPPLGIIRRIFVKTYLEIALIITSIALIISVVLQSKGVGLGGLTGADTGGVFTARRGIEKTLFYITIGLSAVFLILNLILVVVG
jgi:preprotein translocase subunit SecG